MRVYASPSRESRSWFVKLNRVNMAPLKRLARTWSGEIHVVVVSSLFLVLFTATFLIGGHAAIDSLLQSAAKERDSRNVGDIVYTMPDGVFCRHMSYDNVTGEQTGGSVQRCDSDIVRNRGRSNSHFTWHTN